MSLEDLRAAAAAYPAAFPEELCQLAAGCCSRWEDEALRLAGIPEEPPEQGLAKSVLEAGAALAVGRAAAGMNPAALSVAEFMRRRLVQHAAMQDILRNRAAAVRALLPR